MVFAMLHDLIVANRELIIDRARQRVRDRMSLRSTDANLGHGVPLFLDQLVDALAEVASAKGLHLVGAPDASKKINDSAALHGHELLKDGFTVAQVVHGYGDVCQVVTELAFETHDVIPAEDFHAFNRCLDDAIAGAVTAYGRHREIDLASDGTERREVLTHELRNLLRTATLSFDVIKRGTVGLTGSTGAVLARSLSGLAALVERSLTVLRLEAGAPKLERIVLPEFIDEIQITAAMQAMGHGLSLFVSPVASDLAVDADRLLLASVISTLLQNAFKFTHANGEVSLRTRATDDRVLIDICDECGGLPAERAEELSRGFTQKGSDHSELGRGLSLALTAVGVNAGDISVRDMPGTGCVFTIGLPRQHAPAAPIFHMPPHSDRGAPEASGNGSRSGAHSHEPKARAF